MDTTDVEAAMRLAHEILDGVAPRDANGNRDDGALRAALGGNRDEGDPITAHDYLVVAAWRLAVRPRGTLAARLRRFRECVVAARLATN